MIFIKITLTLILFPAILLAQNLVKNPDFLYSQEEMSANINVLEGWRGFGTVDYYHPNNIKFFPWYSLPNNWSGYVQPKSGEACVGFVFLADDGGFEHVQGELLYPLEVNKKYYVRFWIKMSKKNSAGRNLGIYFSNDSNFFKCIDGSLGFRYLNYLHCFNSSIKAQISSPENLFLTDTSWTEISGVYTAKGGEKYFTIGLFWQDKKEIVQAYDHAIEPIKSSSKKDIRKHNMSVRKFYLALSSYILTKNPYINKIKTKNLIDGKHNGAYYFLDAVSVAPLDSLEKK